MVELIRCNDPALLSWVEALLKDAGIEAVILDHHMSTLVGFASVFSRRVLVTDDDAEAARQLLVDADLGDQLK